MTFCVRAVMPGHDVEAARPGDLFVSVPFNAVVLVTWGLISVHSHRLSCLISILAVAVYLISTVQLQRVYAEATWKHLPASKVSEADVTEFLILGLVRWISSLLFSASVIKVVCRLIPFAELFNERISVTRLAWIAVGAVILFYFRIATGGAEWDMLQPISRNKSIHYHFISSLLGGCLRATFQAVFCIRGSRRWSKGMDKSAVSSHKAHVFMCSILILTQNSFSIYLRGVDGFIMVDIGLQLLLINKTWKYIRKSINIPLPSSQLCSLKDRTLAKVSQFIFSAATSLLAVLDTGMRNYILGPMSRLQGVPTQKLRSIFIKFNQLRNILTIIFPPICAAVKIVAVQFVVACQNYIENFLNDDIREPNMQEEIIQAETSLQFSPEHFQCNLLAQRHLDNCIARQPNNNASYAVLVQPSPINQPQPPPTGIPKPVSDTLPQSLCRLETQPCEAHGTAIGEPVF